MNAWVLYARVARSSGRDSALSTDEQRRFIKLATTFPTRPKDCHFNPQPGWYVATLVFDLSPQPSPFDANVAGDNLMKGFEDSLAESGFKICDYDVVPTDG